MLQTGSASLGDQLPVRALAPRYERHRPEQTLLYQIVDKHYPDFLAQLAAEGKFLPDHVQQEFVDFLKCGLLEHGFLRVRCESCHHEKLVAFSCKRRGFCPSCGARRIVDSAALLVDEVLPKKPIRQWVLTVPFPLRFLFAAYPELMSKVLGIVTRTLSTHLAHQSGFKKKEAYTGAVTLIELVNRITDASRWERWLFNELHSLDFQFLLQRRPLWDIVVISLSLIGLGFSISAVVIGWRRLTN